MAKREPWVCLLLALALLAAGVIRTPGEGPAETRRAAEAYADPYNISRRGASGTYRAELARGAAAIWSNVRDAVGQRCLMPIRGITG
ncbi:MAG TPA: hypothetical protein VFJ58_16065 [Armatimonadota bacterium]|nr:hypothetical protein [Armatimonadota bacterium]